MSKQRIKFERDEKLGLLWIVEHTSNAMVKVGYIIQQGKKVKLFDRQNQELFCCEMLERAKAVAKETFEDEDCNEESHEPNRVGFSQDSRFYSSQPFGNTFGVIV